MRVRLDWEAEVERVWRGAGLCDDVTVRLYLDDIVIFEHKTDEYDYEGADVHAIEDAIRALKERITR